MKTDMTPDGNHRIWVRQSWLNDLMICPERARLNILMPEWRSGTDATHIGTAVHKGIEHIITHEQADNGTKVALDELERLIVEEPFRVNSTNGVEEMRSYVPNLLGAWVRDIFPSVKLGGKCEQTFGVKLIDTSHQLPENGAWRAEELWLGGTIDYIDPDGVVWDWKTAARRYSQGEKQKQSIQATAYAIAVVENGWAPQYPVTFKYGVVTRVAKSAGQIVPVVRTQQHVDWFINQVESAVNMFSSWGLDKPWMANDQHGLCSEKWCPFWSICKGSRISDLDNNPEEGN